MKAKNKMKAKTILILLMAALMILFTACDSSSNTTSGQQKSFIFEVTDASGNVTSQTIDTKEATVGDALVELGLIDGPVSDFGMMVLHVNGIRADYGEDNAWWQVLVNGEMAMVGVDSLEIEDGATYSFVFTEA